MEQEPQKQENKEELDKEVEDIIRKKINVFLSKVYSTLNWCWQATIIMFIVQQVLQQIGYYGLSFWGVTVFLWGPPTLVVALCALIVFTGYVFCLLGSWYKFFNGILAYFGLGFKEGIKKADE